MIKKHRYRITTKNTPYMFSKKNMSRIMTQVHFWELFFNKQSFRDIVLSLQINWNVYSVNNYHFRIKNILIEMNCSYRI